MASDGIHSVAVLGLGTMGHGIAQTFAAAGYAVRCYDEQSAARASLHERARSNLLAFVEARLVPPENVEPILSRLTICDSEAETVAGVRFVTEAVNEDLVVKQELFARLETLVAADTILASNSSTFPISQTNARMQRPERALVTHWFNPPHLVPLVEVVPGPDTHEETTRTTMRLMQRIGKQPLWLRKELPGFLVNRVQVAIQREVWDLLERGVASAEEIDAALRGSVGFRMAAVGPLEVHDFGGLDIQTTVYRNLAPQIRSDSEVPALVQKLVEEGYLGAKTGRGFHEYSSERLVERRARRDALFLALVKLLYPVSNGGPR
jgi:3-hydroxybutyryl-CoA dehydrogenase